MTDTQSISKVTDIINGSHIGMLTTINEEGALVSRPLAVQEVQGRRRHVVLHGPGTSQVAHVRADPRVNVSFGKNTEWVSVAGTAEVVTDRAKIREMWNQAVEAWFPDGPDTPEVCLLRVDSDSAEYWTSPGGTAATVLQWVKSKVTNSRMSVGESGTVDLLSPRKRWGSAGCSTFCRLTAGSAVRERAARTAGSRTSFRPQTGSRISTYQESASSRARASLVSSAQSRICSSSTGFSLEPSTVATSSPASVTGMAALLDSPGACATVMNSRAGGQRQQVSSRGGRCRTR